MKVIFCIAVLLSVLLISDVSCKRKRNDISNEFLDTLKGFNKKKFDFTDEQCANVTEVKAKCNEVFGNKSNTERSEVLGDFLISIIDLKADEIRDRLALLCELSSTVEKCLKKCKKGAGKDYYEKQKKKSSLLYFLNKNKLCSGKNIHGSLKKTLSEDNLKKCFNDDDKKEDYKKALEHLIYGLRAAKEILKKDEKDLTADDEEKLKQLCKGFANFKKQINNVLYGCKDEKFRCFFMSLYKLILPPIVADFCEIKDECKKGKKFNARDKNRITIYLFGCFHKLLPSNKLQTCNLEDGQSVVLIDLPQVKVTCNVSEVQNCTRIVSCTTSLYDENRDLIDSVEFNGENVPENFKYSKGKDIEKGKGKGKGKPKSKINLNKVSNKKLRIFDRNSGVSFTLFIFKDKNGQLFYNVAIRLSNNALDILVGELISECVNDVDVNSSGKRRKRAASQSDIDAAQNYDVKKTGDDNAKSMGSDMVSEVGSLEGLDSIITSSGATMTTIAKWFLPLSVVITLWYGL